MEDSHTTAAVQRYLNDLAGVRGDSPAEPIVRELLASAVNRLNVLCSSLLFHSYPRLTRPPLNLQTDELLSSVVERLLKAMRQVRPQTVRQFFALANQHMRWELNDLARRLDERAAAVELRDSLVPAPPDSSEAQISPNTYRILEVIEGLTSLRDAPALAGCGLGEDGRGLSDAEREEWTLLWGEVRLALEKARHD